MKDSGIPWVGEIPVKWDVEHIQGCFTCEDRKNDCLTRTVAMKFYDGTIVPKPSVEFDEQSLRILSGYQFVDKDAIVINGLNLNYDLKSKRVGLALSDGIITSAYMVINPLKNQIDPRYANYLFKGYDYRKAFHNMGVGIRKTLSWNEFKHVYMPLPSFSEQKRIADYLDEYCAAIDEVRRTIEDEVEALRRLRKAAIHRAVTKGLDEGVSMRDSGVEWIGEIPEDWDIVRIKNCLRRHDEKGHGDATVLSLYRDHGVVIKDSRDDNHNRTGRDTDSYKFVRKGDLVINKMKAWQGSLSVSGYEGIVSPAYFIYEFIDEKLSKQYADYLFRTVYAQEFKRVSGGIREGQWDLPAYDFERMPLLLPSLSEQQRIVDYLDERCSAIDSVVDIRTQQLQRLDDYRRALIFACVTGKKEVPFHE